MTPKDSTGFWVFAFLAFLVCLAIMAWAVLGIFDQPTSAAHWILFMGMIFPLYVIVIHPVRVRIIAATIQLQQERNRAINLTPEVQRIKAQADYMRQYQETIRAINSLNQEQLKFAADIADMPAIEITGVDVVWRVGDVRIPVYFTLIWYDKFLARPEGQLPADRDFAGLPDRDLLRSYNRAIRQALGKLGAATNVDQGRGSKFPSRFLIDSGKALNMIGFPAAYNIALFLDFANEEEGDYIDMGAFKSLETMEM